MRISALNACQYLIFSTSHRVCTLKNIDITDFFNVFLSGTNIWGSPFLYRASNKAVSHDDILPNQLAQEIINRLFIDFLQVYCKIILAAHVLMMGSS